MTPLEANIYKTLGMLVMLSRSKTHIPNLSDEERATLTISKQILADSGLLMPEFTNALQKIAEKGYFWHVIFFDEHLRAQMNEFLNSPLYVPVMEKLKELDTEEFSEKLKAAASEDFQKMVPHGVSLDQEELDSDEIKFSEAFMEGIGAFKKLRPDEVGIIILMPFRDIKTLYDRMGNGEKFDDIQDDGFWYDQNNLRFYIDEQSIPTEHKGAPTLAHYVLKEFFTNPTITKVDYDDIAEFDMSKGTDAYQDAMRNFVKKHPKLKTIFTVHKYHTEFHPDNY